MTKTCDRCGSSFEAAERGNGVNRRYCSENCRKRLCEERARAGCVDCGEPCSAGSKWSPGQRCAGCEMQRVANRRWVRRRGIQLAWEDGLTLAQIADALDTTQGTIQAEVSNMRREGWDMPYRHHWPAETLERQRHVWKRRVDREAA